MDNIDFKKLDAGKMAETALLVTAAFCSFNGEAHSLFFLLTLQGLNEILAKHKEGTLIGVSTFESEVAVTVGRLAALGVIEVKAGKNIDKAAVERITKGLASKS
jgi:hypothetical protein